MPPRKQALSHQPDECRTTQDVLSAKARETERLVVFMGRVSHLFLMLEEMKRSSLPEVTSLKVQDHLHSWVI